jgi:hypothetical protein
MLQITKHTGYQSKRSNNEVNSKKMRNQRRQNVFTPVLHQTVCKGNKHKIETRKSYDIYRLGPKLWMPNGG